jgi:hypothetical protein
MDLGIVTHSSLYDQINIVTQKKNIIFQLLFHILIYKQS